MLKIRELIKKVRACKTAEEERSVINKESAEIRNASKDLNNPHKARDLAKAIYMQMMGYQTSFMQLSCINLMASKNFTEKRMAYSALSLVMDETSKVLLLATGTIKKDLVAEDDESVALALNAIGDVCTPDMCRELSYEVANIIKRNNNPNIKKKAACAAAHIIKKCPELVESYKDKIGCLIEDKTHSVCMAGIILMLEMIKINPKIAKSFKDYHSTFIKYEKSLLNVTYAPEFDINGVSDPFLQARIIEILKYTCKSGKEAMEELADLFVTVQSLTESGKQAGYAIQYEIVKAINELEANKGMKSLSSNIIGKFLASKDLNLKYIALNTLKDVVRFDLAEVQKHKDLILSFLNESDISLQKRALDLIYLIINSNNLKQITKECLKFIPKAENELKLEITSKLTDCIDQYAKNFKWEIDTLIKIVIICENNIYDDTLSKIINIIIKVKELKVYSAHKLFICLKNNKENIGLIKVAIYVLGEYCEALINNTVIGPEKETIKVSIEELIEELKNCGERNKDSFSVLEYMLNALIKISVKFENKKEEIKEIFEAYNKNYFYEVQQRANEYLVLENSQNEELKQKVTENIPTPIEDDIKDKELIDVNEEDDEEYKIKLRNIPTKGEIPSNEGNIEEGISKENNPQEETKKEGGVNLLDLENIFGGGSNPTEIPLQNNNSNTQSQNPFDLLSLGNLGGNPTVDNPLMGGNTQTTSSNNPFDLLGDIGAPIQQDNNVPQQPTESPQMKQCFSDQYITLYYQINKTSPVNYEGSIYASNNCSEMIENIKINFMVLKFVTLKVLYTSGTSLEPQQSLGIKKDFVMTSNDPDKKVVMKIKLSYQFRGNETTSMMTLDDF